MSLAIQVNDVAAVLLTTGAWLPVERGTFNIDSYEYFDGDETLHGGGRSGSSAAGFQFRSPDGQEVSGPLSAIVAVKRSPERPAPSAIGNIR